MRRLSGLVAAILLSFGLWAQETPQRAQNTAEKMIDDKEQRLSIGGYGQIDFNQPIDSDTRYNGKLDVHRLVLMFGYKFSEKTQFISEIEVEHVEEIFVEQAFLNHKITDWLNFRGGLMLIPMGIVNEYHEPPTFNGVERPNLDKYLIPTTWREIGAGFTGDIHSANLKYQLYLVNGFNGYGDSGKLNGKNGLRKGRQKGIESYISSPNLSMKVDYYGIPGLQLGLAGYFGDTQSTLYNGIDKEDDLAKAKADSSVVGVAMIGLDARYKINGWEFRGQYNYTSLSNTKDYNDFTGSDLGSAMSGYYLEAGYNLFHNLSKTTEALVPFVRYEKYDTHQKVAGNLVKNEAYNITEVTAGLGWRITPGAVLKADYNWKKSEADDDFKGTINMGIGVWF